jgi:two-component system KDP operon response regulator KdpE
LVDSSARLCPWKEGFMRYAERGHDRDRLPEVRLGAPKILLLDDDDAMRELVRGALTDAGYDVLEIGCVDALRVLDGLEGDPISLIVLDERVDGLRLLRALRARRTPVILTTDHPDSYIRAEAERAGAVLLAKPFRLDALRALVLATLAAEANRRSGGPAR